MLRCVLDVLLGVVLVEVSIELFVVDLSGTGTVVVAEVTAVVGGVTVAVVAGVMMGTVAIVEGG